MTSQLEKNTVPAQNQIPDKEFVTFIGNKEAKLRIAFVGNSITRHEVAPHLGWMQNCGMAASTPDKDYVHLIYQSLKQQYGDVSACICNAAEWEWNYMNGSTVYHYFEAVKEFQPHILVMRLVENSKAKTFDAPVFGVEYQKFIDYLKNEDTKVIVSTAFWHHPGDETICQVAKEQGYPCVCLGDLGELDEMKAIGKFEHSGVALHPGDLGMQTIAERIMKEIEKLDITL